MLRDCQFEPGDSDRALYLPPSASPLMHRFAKPAERLGERLFTRFGGVLMVEATKQIYATSTARPVARRRLVVAPGAVGVARTRD